MSSICPLSISCVITKEVRKDYCIPTVQWNLSDAELLGNAALDDLQFTFDREGFMKLIVIKISFHQVKEGWT